MISMAIKAAPRWFFTSVMAKKWPVDNPLLAG
jgi:hypothetical protein